MSNYGLLTFTLLHSITRYLKRAIAVRLQIEAIPRKVRRNPVALHILEPMSHPNLKLGFTYPKTSQTFFFLLGRCPEINRYAIYSNYPLSKKQIHQKQVKVSSKLKIQHSAQSKLLYCIVPLLLYSISRILRN